MSHNRPTSVGVLTGSLVVAITLSIASCGAARSYPAVASGGAQQSATPLNQTPSVAPGYSAYVSKQWQYSLEYPAQWLDLPNFGAPDRQKYFSNENTESPEHLTASGIWLTIDVNSQPSTCASNGPPASDVTQTPISIDGAQTTEYVGQASILVLVQHSGWCYTIGFATNGAQDRDQHATEIAHIFSTFRFNR
jgi:hypothetical protein